MDRGKITAIIPLGTLKPALEAPISTVALKALPVILLSCPVNGVWVEEVLHHPMATKIMAMTPTNAEDPRTTHREAIHIFQCGGLRVRTTKEILDDTRLSRHVEILGLILWLG
jgi:hypothetical protein